MGWCKEKGPSVRVFLAHFLMVIRRSLLNNRDLGPIEVN